MTEKGLFMITLPYLTDDEIKGIVRPLTQPAAIVRWFRANHYDVKVKPNGMPLITRANFEAVGTGSSAKPDAAACESPDVAAYLKTISRNAKPKAVSQKV